MTAEFERRTSKQRRCRILEILRDRRSTTASALAADVGCDVRTIYRDMEELMAYGLPIDSQHGAGAGYRWRGNSL